MQRGGSGCKCIVLLDIWGGELSGEWFHGLPRQDNASLLLCASIHMGRMLVWHQWELTRAQSQ